jgi:hypothetical protein
MMNNKQTKILAIMAFSAAQSTSGFVVNTPPSHVASSTNTIGIRRPLFSTVEDTTSSASSSSSSDIVADAYQQVADVTASVEEAAAMASESSKLIMDIPPSPSAASAATPKAKAAPKKKNPAHKEGIFSPLVIAAGTILGPEQLNKIRAKVISLHSDIIKSFVDTADSSFGKAVLVQLFNAVDTDNSGYIDKDELGVALSLLGFRWLKEKQIDGIFSRADVNGDGMISLEEFMDEAPKTLKTNLVKLAKNNGGDMGLLV